MEPTEREKVKEDIYVEHNHKDDREGTFIPMVDGQDLHVVDPVAADELTPRGSPPVTVKYITISVLLLLVATGAQVADAQLSKEVYSDEFNASFLMMYVNQIVRIFTFPIFLFASACVAYWHGRAPALNIKIRKALQLWGPEGPTVMSLAKTIGVMGIATIAGLGLSRSALEFLSASDTVVLMTSQVAMVYVISMIFLRQTVLIFKVAATALCFVGVGLTAYSHGFEANSIRGVILALVSSLIFSADQVYMKFILKKTSLSQICLYMTSTAIFILLIGWTVPLAMKLTDTEKWEFVTAQWGLIFAAGGSALLNSFIMNYGIIYTSPFFMSMTYLVRIPIINLIDAFGRDETFTNFEIGGAVCICVGFILIVLPDDRVSVPVRRWMGLEKKI